MVQNRWRPVPLAMVNLDDDFWAPRQRLSREVTLPFQYKQLQEVGHLRALDLAWQPGEKPVPHIFWESDIAKWLEAVSYSLAKTPDAALDALADQVIAKLAAAQQPDGYLNVYFTVVKPGRRWTDLHHAHELYCAGHLIEAGVAHFEATGKRSLLGIVCRYADCIAAAFGREEGKIHGYCGHPEIELALVRLFHATGERRYLDLSRCFVDERGREPHYFDQEDRQRGEPGYFDGWLRHSSVQESHEYNQSHLPVREQRQAVGHAVRAMYLYSAMTDLAGELGDEGLLQACRGLWDHLTGRRMYVTGGIGTAARNEGFTTDYDLPNHTAYAETCAAIGLVFWSQRMALLEHDARYVDILERALFNGVISGISLDGTRFFYTNRLASEGDEHRKEWFGVACCPPNLARLLLSLGQYVYAHGENELAVNLYIEGSMRCTVAGRQIEIRQETQYPWGETVALHVDVPEPTELDLLLRIPGWCRQALVEVNGRAEPLDGVVERGYARLRRTWSFGDVVMLKLPMPVERLRAHPAVHYDAGCVALQRGPLVYCLETADNRVPLQRVLIPEQTGFEVGFEPGLLGGAAVLRCAAWAEETDAAAPLYGVDPPRRVPVSLTAIPYYAWDNRGGGQMRVWLRAMDGSAGNR